MKRIPQKKYTYFYFANGLDIITAINVIPVPATLVDLVNIIVTYILIIAGILAFIFLLYSGILYITAGGNPDQAKKAQQGLLNAIIGILIISLSLVILKAVANLGKGVFS